MKLLSVYDTKAQVWSPPLTFRTIAEGIRAFAAAANDPSHTWGRFPTDFVLFEIGSFDETSAAIDGTTLNSLGAAIEFVEISPTPPFAEDGSLRANFQQTSNGEDRGDRVEEGVNHGE